MTNSANPWNDFCTPFAKIDVPTLNDNIASYANFFKTRKIALRPHIKTHKCVEIAQLQIAAGATGLTVATIAEAEQLSKCMINDLFIAYPIVGQPALARYAALHRRGKICCSVDSVAHLEQLCQIGEEDLKIRFRIEINCGQNRCGIRPAPEEFTEILTFFRQHDRILHLDGVFTHAGHAYKCQDSQQIARIAEAENEAVQKAAQILRREGIDCTTISTGSTPTALYSQSGCINECRPGNYVFFDAIQVANSTTKLDSCAFTVVSRIIGKYNDRLVIDAGSKALGLDRGAHGLNLVQGFGIIRGQENLVISSLSEEHGIILCEKDPKDFAIGDFVEIIPNHSCAAANMFSFYRVFNAENYAGEWQIIGKR